ncbi:MAG TPA: hypothetical protein VMM79_10140 [Longimicrobiales bacterium]|jgi:uncharacterized glyoxalase superfamily protein PhnB|nr:hypothetical protein [Longimicrobiales bacterium]
MNVKKLTPILTVDAIEPCLPFWLDRLGFTKTTEVPHEDRLGFVILERDGIEVMYQTIDSVAADLPALASLPRGGSILFIEVDDIAAIEKAMAGADIVVPRRSTFYGADEVFAREPGGHIVGFAEFPDRA